MGMANQFKTVILLGLLTGILLWVGNLVGGMQGLTIALIFAIVMNFGSYWFSDKLVLAMYRAKEVKEGSETELFSIVREVSHLANTPMPKVYIMEAPHANAFATGRSPKKAAVAVTRGIMDLLSKDELKGVIAHEISHIKNRDTLIQAVAATIAGVISYVAFMARWAAIFGGMGGDRDNSGLELLVLAILTPILAAIIQMAISRSREFLADESGAKILHSGLGLADALEKLDGSKSRVALRPSSTTQTTAHLFIMNPFRGNSLFRMFSTHPPIKERVKRLRSGSY
jgi:heat shock protein HtpX|tara:strand:+ start:848 stop:1702 length:855 start_codon:yes stop_codon:yes gene_type:complete